MKVIKQSYEILTNKNIFSEINSFIEKCARTCYKSEDKITENSSAKLIKTLIKSGHHSVLEHFSLSVKFVTDRAVTHELVRHRLASYSQESQRYVNYKEGVEFILPTWISGKYLGEYLIAGDVYKKCNDNAVGSWLNHMMDSESRYVYMVQELKLRPEQARTILPNSTKTEIVVTANLREWRHIFKLRCSKRAYPPMRSLMLPLLKELSVKLPLFFENIYDDKNKKENI